MRAWAVVFVVVALLSCTRTVYVPVTEHRNVYTTVRDTVIVLAERGDTVERITPDTVSLITCKGAESEARVVEGVLHHRLAVHERRDSVRVQVHERLVIDSVPYPVYVDFYPGTDMEGRSDSCHRSGRNMFVVWREALNEAGGGGIGI